MELSGNPLQCVAEANIPFSDATIHAASDEGWVQAIAKLRPALAGLGFTGRMELSALPNLFHEEEKLNEAFALSDEELIISAEYAERVRQGEAR